MSAPVIDRLEIAVRAITRDSERVACRESLCMRPSEFRMERKYIHPDISLPKLAVMFYCAAHLDAALRNAATYFANDVHTFRRQRAERAS